MAGGGSEVNRLEHWRDTGAGPGTTLRGDAAPGRVVLGPPQVPL
jgi:hypothetical protein